jgi:hypothetical protein
MIPKTSNPGVVSMFTCPKDGYQDFTGQLPSGRIQDLMAELTRQGLNTSLRSLQVWAELARQVGPQVLGCSPDGTRVFVAGDHEFFGKLLAAQREIVDELVAAHHELSQRYLALR